MKNIATALTLGLLTQFASGQEVPSRTYEIRAEIVDGDGKPVQDAVVQSSRHELIPGSPVPQSKNVLVHSSTDQNGIAILTLISVQPPDGVVITKDGFYLTTAKAEWEYPRRFDTRRNLIPGGNVRRP